MDLNVALVLVQDGITNGAIYALLSLALVLVFAVTRVIFIPQGEFVAYGALSMAAINAGFLPPTMWLVVMLGIAVAIVDSVGALREEAASRLPMIIFKNAVLPILAVVAVHYLPLKSLAYPLQVAIALAFVVPLGPQIYRLAFQPVAEATVLLLLIVAVAVHFVLVGLGLYFFGAEGGRTPAFTDGGINLGATYIQFQTVWIVGIAAALIAGLALFFERSIYGKALRATAINRTGARLMGISADLAGKLCFTLAALVGAFSGILIAPITTIYYDTGFLIGLKGFVGAIIGGLASYPLAAAGAILVGLLESYSSFYASAYKEVIVFTLIIPVLLWQSLTKHHVEDEDDH
ncbi:MAG: branched-chain amino acid ABC transporter permease [Rhodocyclales bacterium]|nr:branched-chain amino acid ABC transporter permease [Rhodocyclales bacterium]